MKMFLFIHFSAYQVIVLKIVDGAKDLPDDYDSKLKDASDTDKGNLNFYIAAEILNVPVYEESWKFTIGDDKTYRAYVNKGLERGEDYVFYQRAVTHDNDVSKELQPQCSRPCLALGVPTFLK